MPVPPPQMFDRVPPLLSEGAGGLPEPYVYDASPRALRSRVVAYGAKRFVDMMYVTGLDRATALKHFRAKAVGVPGGLDSEPDNSSRQAELVAAWRSGQISLDTDDADRCVTVRWDDPEFGEPVVAAAIARPGYGGILLGARRAPSFEPRPLRRREPDFARPWPLGDADPPMLDRREPAGAELRRAADHFFETSSGVYGVLVATPERILLEQYGDHGAPDRPTPSWSMTKAITSTLIARMLHEGWLGSVYDPAPAPLWRDPRAIHRLITIDDLLRMRSGLGFPISDGGGRSSVVFENSFVYHNAEDAFATAQRAIVATRPGSVFRYINTGINVLGAIIRDRIESRGLPYHETVYGLLADRIGMTSYQHSADCLGNLIASGSGAARLRDYAKLGILYLQDGSWDGERLLPKGWVDYAQTPTHRGSAYTACFRANADRMFPSLPPDTAWASGASDQRVMILRRHELVITVTNETDHPIDYAALDRLGAAAVALVS